MDLKQRIEAIQSKLQNSNVRISSVECKVENNLCKLNNQKSKATEKVIKTVIKHPVSKISK